MKFALSAIGLGLLLGVLLPPLAFKEGFEGMLTFLGLVFASVVPAMALTVSTLRASRRSICEVRLLSGALRKQLSFWMSFLAVTGVLAILLLMASALGWPQNALGKLTLGYITLKFTPMSVLNSLIMMLLILVLGKAPAFARGMSDLLSLHLDQVEAESLASLQQEHVAVAEEITAERPDVDTGFGRMIDRKPPTRHG